MNKMIKVLQKIRDYVEHLDDIINKAKLFDSGLRKARSTFGAKKINILVNYAAKMKPILDEMRVLFIGLE